MGFTQRPAKLGRSKPNELYLAELQQAKRQGIDPREIKQAFRQAWEHSDGLPALKAALEERGYHLARGDRRGVVALDVNGSVYSLSRWSAVKAKDIRDKIGKEPELPSVAELSDALRGKVTAQMQGYIQQVKARHADEMSPLYQERAAMVLAQRSERQTLKQKQDDRWQQETATRSARLSGGLRGLFDRPTGKAKATKAKNEKEAYRCLKRDQDQRDALFLMQARDRRALQAKAQELKAKHKKERTILAHDVASTMRRSGQSWAKGERHKRHHQQRGPTLDR